MFEITRRPQEFSPLKDMVNFLTNDPFFRVSAIQLDDEGNLPIDVVEGENELIVRASMPGFEKDDIDVQVHNGILSIKAEHTEETETKEERFYRRERRTGSVSRRIALPGVVTEANAEADLKNGILTVRIPNAEVARPKQINIK